MKLRNILITAAAVGFMFASMNRTNVVGYTAGDYADMETFPHNMAGQNVAWTSHMSDFTAVWTDDGTTWGFKGGDNQNLVDMMWSNGSMGLSVGMEMTEGDDGETNFDVGFGMGLMGMDMGFNYNTGSADMGVNLRGGCGFWAFDTFTFAMNMYGEGDGAAGTSANYAATTKISAGLYGVNDWGAATGMFGIGFTSDDDVEGDWVAAELAGSDDVVVDPGNCDDGAGNMTADCGTGVAEGDVLTAAYWDAINADGYTAINTNFSVESTLTDWCDLRIGYSKAFNLADNSTSDSYGVGLGFNYGSVGLDMTLTQGTLDKMLSNPIHYATGRNDLGLTSEWTLTYSW